MSRTLAVLFTAWATTALAQQPGDSEQTYKRLGEAERKLLDGKAAEALDDLQHVLDEAGDDLVQADKDKAHFRPARWVAQVVLAKLPPDVLRAYRDRADEPARRLLEAGKKARDPRPLRTLLDRYFVSRPAEEALLLLGELAFERGEFRAAEGYWRRLLPSTDPAAEPSFPDSKTDPAAVRARIILAAIFAGELDRARQELKLLKEHSPKAAGRLAGKDGPFVETLQALLDRPPVLAAERLGDGEWTGFAGSAARDGRATGRLPYYWPGRPTWATAIPTDPAERKFTYPRAASARAAAFHPVVLDGVAYLADPVRVFGFDLKTGARRFAFDLREQQPAAGQLNVTVPLPIPYDADFTLTAADDRLFARLGAPTVPPSGDAAGAGQASYLVCFAPQLHPTPDGPPLQMRWVLPPPAAPGVSAAWEGAPVWFGGRLYAAFAWADGNDTVQAVTCFDDPPGKPAWVTEVGRSRSEPRTRHELLTLAGQSLVFCTHVGSVVAVDARTGKANWAFRYPTAARPPVGGSPRDLCPPLASGGRVFVAPADADRVFALDAETGRTLWQTEPIQVDQLLGVSHGRLVCTVAGPNRGIRGLNVVTGSDREDGGGWAVHDDPNLKSYGRGLVTDELILWPTGHGLFLLNPEDGLPRRPALGHLGDTLDSATFGNLAFAGGVLLVATPTELWGYVSDRAQMNERKAAAAARPNDPEAAWRLARALADSGRWDEADRAVRDAEPATDPARVRAEWLADRSERALAAGHPEEARALLRRGLGKGYPTDWRVRAAGRLLTLEPAGGGESAVRRYFARLGQPDGFGSGWLLGKDGVPVRLRDLAARHFGADSSAPSPASPTKRSSPGPPTEFGVVSLHRLGPVAAVDHETPFPSVRCIPLLPFAGLTGLPGLGSEAGSELRLLVTDGVRVLAYRPGDDNPAWEARLPDGLTVTHAAAVGETVVAAGPRGAVALKLADGRRMWMFRLPDADPLPAGPPQSVPRSTEAPVTLPGMSDFALAGSRLIARVGDHHLLALDTASGSVAWMLSAAQDAHGPSRTRTFSPFPFGSAPRFTRFYYADGQAVIVQVSTGVRWTIDPATGGVTHIAPTAPVPWEGPPVRLAAGRMAVADGAELVTELGTEEGAPAWTVKLGGEASLTGRPPQVKRVPDGLIVAASRNYGVELDRVLGAGGTRAWPSPVLIPAGEVDLSAADTDLVNLYVPAEGRLTAVQLASRRVAWVADLTAESGLPTASWRVRAGRKAVIAYPETPVAADSLPAVLGRAARSFASAPAAWRLPGLAVGLYDAWASRSVPVLVLDPDTGRVCRRLDLPAAGPALGVHLGPDRAVVVTAGRAYWLK